MDSIMNSCRFCLLMDVFALNSLPSLPLFLWICFHDHSGIVISFLPAKVLLASVTTDLQNTTLCTLHSTHPFLHTQIPMEKGAYLRKNSEKYLRNIVIV